MSVHAGEIPIKAVANQLSSYLRNFDAIGELYRRWAESPLEPQRLKGIFDQLPERHAKNLWQGVIESNARTVYDAYNAATHYATHQMRSYRTAFDLLERINHGFQEVFPASGN